MKFNNNYYINTKITLMFYLFIKIIIILLLIYICTFKLNKKKQITKNIIRFIYFFKKYLSLLK